MKYANKNVYKKRKRNREIGCTGMEPDTHRPVLANDDTSLAPLAMTLPCLSPAEP
jgi:hypothetical protein